MERGDAQIIQALEVGVEVREDEEIGYFEFLFLLLMTSIIFR